MSNEKLSIILTFGNQKGGVMKTTLTSLFANHLHLKTDFNVLVIDADRQKSITTYRQLDKLDGFEEDVMYDLVTIPAIDVPKKINNVLNEYDFILIDLPGNLYEPGVMDCYKLVDYLFVPTNTTVADLTSFYGFIKDYNTEIVPKRLKAKFDPAVIHGVFTKVNRQLAQYKSERIKADEGKFEVTWKSADKMEVFNVPFLKNDVEYNETTFGNQVSTAKVYKNYKGKDYSVLCEEIIEVMTKTPINNG